MVGVFETLRRARRSLNDLRFAVKGLAHEGFVRDLICCLLLHFELELGLFELYERTIVSERVALLHRVVFLKEVRLIDASEAHVGYSSLSCVHVHSTQVVQFILCLLLSLQPGVVDNSDTLFLNRKLNVRLVHAFVVRPIDVAWQLEIDWHCPLFLLFYRPMRVSSQKLDRRLFA